MNAWPLDEGLIDYVAGSYGTESDENPLYTANVIANPSIEINGAKVDASKITPELLSGTLQEAGDIEANVATGYHAIEFLLWGQDLNGTGPGAGERPYTDYDTANCTGGNCDRRAAVSEGGHRPAGLRPRGDGRQLEGRRRGAQGAARRRAEGRPVDHPHRHGLAVLWRARRRAHEARPAAARSRGGARLLLRQHATSRISTTRSASATPITASYKRIDGSVVEGPSVSGLVKEADPAIDAELTGKLDATVAKMEAIQARAEGGEAYDQQIGEGNAEGNATVQAAIDALVDQTKSIERAVGALKLDAIAFEGSDSLDAPDKVFQ